MKQKINQSILHTSNFLPFIDVEHDLSFTNYFPKIPRYFGLLAEEFILYDKVNISLVNFNDFEYLLEWLTLPVLLKLIKQGAISIQNLENNLMIGNLPGRNDITIGYFRPVKEQIPLNDLIYQSISNNKSLIKGITDNEIKKIEKITKSYDGKLHDEVVDTIFQNLKDLRLVKDLLNFDKEVDILTDDKKAIKLEFHNKTNKILKLMSVNQNLFIASQIDADLELPIFEQEVLNLKINDLFSRFKKTSENFYKLLNINDIPSVQYLVNSNYITSEQILNLRDNEGKKFRLWMQGITRKELDDKELKEDNLIIKQYIKSINDANKKPSGIIKTLKWGIFTGASFVADTLLPLIGGASISAIDNFIIGNITKKWSPNYYLNHKIKRLLPQEIIQKQEESGTPMSETQKLIVYLKLGFSIHTIQYQIGKDTNGIQHLGINVELHKGENKITIKSKDDAKFFNLVKDFRH